KRHKKRDTMALAELAQCRRQLVRPHKTVLKTGATQYARPQPVAWNLRRDRPRKALFPIGQTLLETLASQPVALPGGEIRVLRKRQGKGRRPARRKSGIKCSKFARQKAHRPVVAGDMMDNKYQQMVFVGDPRQQRAEKRPLREIKELLRFDTR